MFSRFVSLLIARTRRIGIMKKKKKKKKKELESLGEGFRNMPAPREQHVARRIGIISSKKKKNKKEKKNPENEFLLFFFFFFFSKMILVLCVILTLFKDFSLFMRSFSFCCFQKE